MILEVLEKIHKRTFDFTPDEVPHAIACLKYIIDKAPQEKLLKLLTQADPIQIAHVMGQLTKEMSALLDASPDTKLRAIMTADNFHYFRKCAADLNDPKHEQTHASNNQLSNIETLTRLAQQKFGNDFATNMLRLDDWKLLAPAFSNYPPKNFLGNKREDKLQADRIVTLAEQIGGRVLVEEMLTANDCQAFRNFSAIEGLRGYDFEDFLSAITGLGNNHYMVWDSDQPLDSATRDAALPMLTRLLTANQGEAFQHACKRDFKMLHLVEKINDPALTHALFTGGEYKTLANLMHSIMASYEASNEHYETLHSGYEEHDLPAFLHTVESRCSKAGVAGMLAANNCEAFAVACKLSGYDDKRCDGDSVPNEKRNISIKLLLDAANAADNKTLAGRMCAANHEAIKALWDEGKHDTVRLIIGALDETNVHLLMQAMPPRWRDTFQGELPTVEMLHDRKTVRELTTAPAQQWRAVTGGDAPDSRLEDESPIGFKKALYDEMLPLMETQKAMVNFSDAGGAPMMAYKIAVLFANRTEASRYFDSYARRSDWNSGNPNYLVHDALLFDIPAEGEWTIPKWKDLILKYGPSASKFLGLAPKIEAYATEHGTPFPTRPAEILEIAAKVSYARAAENPDFAKLAVSHGLGEGAFDTGLDILKSAKTSDKLPDITIDGAEIGHPSFYMEKLKPGDPQGLLLGKMTNCCQYVGAAGEECARHGMTSENGGFYVWKHKTGGRRMPNDDIVAQSWAWRGNDNTLVLDSFERLGPAYDTFARDFLEQFAHEVVGKYNYPGEDAQAAITAVKLGIGGHSPKEAGFTTTTASTPLNYHGYRDSAEQFGIAPVNHKGKMVSQVIAAQGAPVQAMK